MKGHELKMYSESAPMNIWCTCTTHESVVFQICGLHTGGAGPHAVQRDYFSKWKGQKSVIQRREAKEDGKRFKLRWPRKYVRDRFQVMTRFKLSDCVKLGGGGLWLTQSVQGGLAAERPLPPEDRSLHPRCSKSISCPNFLNEKETRGSATLSVRSLQDIGWRATPGAV